MVGIAGSYRPNTRSEHITWQVESLLSAILAEPNLNPSPLPYLPDQSKPLLSHSRPFLFWRLIPTRTYGPKYKQSIEWTGENPYLK